MKARKILEDVYKIIYKNDKNTYKTELEKLNNMSDAELKKKILSDEIYIYVKPFKEPSLKDIKSFADYLGIELDEKLILPSHGNIVTENPVPVGFSPIKFLEQLVYKKIVTSHEVTKTDPITGQATSSSKTRMVSAPELINTFGYPGISQDLFPEYLSARSDDKDANMDMQKQIAETGRFSTKNMSSTGLGQVQKTLSYYLYGSGIDNDILPTNETSVDGTKTDQRVDDDDF